MTFERFLGWLFLNVAVPLLAPMALLPWLGYSKRYWGRGRELVWGSVNEGQLFWAVIAMCAAAIYEAFIRIGEVGTGEAVIGWIAVATHFGIIVVSTFLVLIRMMEVDDERTAAAKAREKTLVGAHSAEPENEVEAGPPQSERSGIVKVSITFAWLTAITFTATHLWAS